MKSPESSHPHRRSEPALKPSARHPFRARVSQAAAPPGAGDLQRAGLARPGSAGVRVL